MAHDPKNLDMTADELAARAARRAPKTRVRALLRHLKCETVMDVVKPPELGGPDWSTIPSGRSGINGEKTRRALIAMLAELGLHTNMTPEEIAAYRGESLPPPPPAERPRGKRSTSAIIAGLSTDKLGKPIGSAHPTKPKTEPTLSAIEFSEISALFESARILCKRVGLGGVDENDSVSNVIGCIAGYFPENSREHLALWVLSNAAGLDLDPHRAFKTTDFQASLDLHEEYLKLKYIG